MIAPLAKKHNIKVKSEATKSNEAYTNEYKSIFKNEIKINKSN